MLTYTKTETTRRPRLVISHDEDPYNPREDTNLGYFITCDSNYHSPDKHEEYERIVKETGDNAKDQAHHMRLITNHINLSSDDEVVKIYPVVKYEHSGVSYSLGTKHGFDHSNNGFYIITKATLKECFSKKPSDKKLQELIGYELDTYTKYANGYVYRFDLYDENGEDIDSCCGFYEIEDIREHLPKEFKDEIMSEYMIW